MSVPWRITNLLKEMRMRVMLMRRGSVHKVNENLLKILKIITYQGIDENFSPIKLLIVSSYILCYLE